MTIEESRKEIDRVNKRIAGNVRDRMDEVLKIMDYKDREDMDIRDEGREEKVRQQFEQLFENKKMPPERGRELADVLIETAVDVQKEFLEDGEQ